MAPAIVEPYNAILATHTSLETVDVCFLVDNQVSGHGRGARRLRHLIPSRQLDQRTSLENKVVGRLQHMIPSGQPDQWTSKGS
jgi:hypothetical protein